MSGQRAVLGPRKRQPGVQFGKDVAAPAIAAADRARIGRGESMPPALTRPADRIHDSPRPDLRPDPAGEPEFPADQPDSAGGPDPVHGLVQQDRAAADPRSVDRVLAAVFRSRSQRGAQDQLQEPARLFYARTPPRAAAGRSRSRRSWSVRATPSSARIGRIAGYRAVPDQGRALFASGPARRSRAGRAAPQWPVHHAAADVQHVSSLSRAA